MSQNPGGAAASVVITTKNRKDDLRNALASAVAQDVPLEVLVIDDGSTDGTSDMVRAEFPSVRLHREEQSGGLIVRRNQGARMATTPLIVSIDDDAAFPSPRTIGQTVAEFDHPRIGAVAIPFIDVKKSPAVRTRAPDAPGIWLAANYIGTAHALRKDVFVAVGGYREILFHQGEEVDYCARMLDAGYVTRLGRADPIHHFESPKRDFSRMDLFGRRNDVLFAWHNVPMPYLIPHVLATTVNGTAFGFRCGRPFRMMRGLGRGYRAVPAQWSLRRPISSATYRLFRRLRKATTPLSLQEIEPDLPPMRSTPVEPARQAFPGK
jgi:glycosyltransferase involved in cell wall biosynthesis